MPALNVNEIREKLNNGYSIRLAYELLLAVREANYEEDNHKVAELQALAREMYGSTPNKNKNDAKVLRAISNTNAYNTLSTRARMLEADVLVDMVTTKYDSKDTAVDAFASLLYLKRTHSHRGFFAKLLGPETRALGNRIDTLAAKLRHTFGNELVDGVLNNTIHLDDISANLPKPVAVAKENKIPEKIQVEDIIENPVVEESKTNQKKLEENDIENHIVEPKVEPKKEIVPEELGMSEEEYLLSLKYEQELMNNKSGNPVSQKQESKKNPIVEPKVEPKKGIVPEGLDLTEEEYLLYLKSEQELKEFYPEQQFINPVFEGVREAFYPVFNKYQDDYDEYCNTLMNRVVNVTLNEKNLEYVLLATYNIHQLNEIKNFINNSPNKEDLEYLVRPLDYKINQLKDTSIVGTTLKDVPIRVEAYKRFIIQDVSNNYYDTVKTSLAMDITSYEAFSNNPELMISDVTTNKQVNERLDAMEKYDTAKNNPSMVTKEQAVVEKDSLLIPLPPMQHQSSDNGCWSCSLQAQLNHFGVNLDQVDIRSLRPSYDTKDMNKNPLVTLRNRISFSYLANRDEKISMVDYAEIIHNTVKNSLVHHAEITNNFFDNVKSLLDKYKTPISCTNGVHYLTIVGYDGDKLIYQDSLHTNPVEHQEGISPEMKEKYKDYCVGDCSDYAAGILDRGMELTWIERYNTKAELKDMITKNNMEYNDSIIRGTSSSCFNKVENAEDPLNCIITNIIISNSDAKELGLGAFGKKNIPFELENNEPKEDIPVNEEEANEFCLLK